MAEGLLRFLGRDQHEAFSAGTEATFVKQEAIQAMIELDIDISNQQSKALDLHEKLEFDAVITVCDAAKKNCPVFPGAKRMLHWPFPDPSGKGIDAFREVRDEIRAKLEAWLKQEA